METNEAVWTQVDLKRLLNGIKTSIPASEKDHGYSRTQKVIDWKKIAFSEYSPVECEAKWRQMFDKMRKQRTMTDLIEEAECAINDPFRPKKHQVHPELPKRPPIPHCLYLKENKEMFKRKYPDLDPQKMMALATSSYKKLPAHVKAEYVQKYKLSREQYDQDLIQLRQKYGKPFQQSKSKTGQTSALKRKMEEQDDLDGETSTTSSRPRKKRRDAELPDQPPLNGFMLFVDEQRAMSKPMVHKDHLRASSQRWKRMKQAERDGYNIRAKELKQQYGVTLKAFLSSLTEEQKEIMKDDLEKLFRTAKKYSKTTLLMFPGEPKKPSWTGASVFCSEKMLRLPGNFRHPRDMFSSITSMWMTLSTEEKAPFCKKGAIKFHRYTLDLQEWYNTLSVETQADYLNQKPEQAKYVAWNVEKPVKKERHIASDSEDEEYLDCYTDVHPEGNDEEEDEEEEQDNEEVLWTHEKLAKSAGPAVEISHGSSDSDTD
ncbi:unnamed protein product [Lota lota]